MLDIDTPVVVVFDWPANQGTNARGYLAAGRDRADTPALEQPGENV